MVIEIGLIRPGVQLIPSHAPLPPPSIVTLVAAAALFGPSACAAPPLPYPDTLADAVVLESKLSDIHSLGLVVGNGELNAIGI